MSNNYNWIALQGEFAHDGRTQQITFKGGAQESETAEGKQNVASTGRYLSDQRFTGGTISANVRFQAVDEDSACEIILGYDPNDGSMITAGIGPGPNMFGIRRLERERWEVLASAGDRRNLKAGIYKLSVGVVGSRVTLTVNGVDVCHAMVPVVWSTAQAGIWCRSRTQLTISGFKVESAPPKAFVVMQFSPDFNELYSDVVKRVCEENGVEAVRADEQFGPGLIIADITRQIREAQIVIAEISPVNANVYYEVGYAHALGKPTILIAERKTELPFDLSAFRTLFYDNSIGGKARVEEGLRKHIKAIFSDTTGI